MHSNYLVLVRHGQSEWNAKNLFTGWKDPDLTHKGIEEAVNAGKKINEYGLSFSCMFTSALVRAQNTAKIILKEIEQEDIPTYQDKNLNERAYGSLTGMDKDEARQKFGSEQVQIWRRSFDTCPPDGESLKDTYNRVVPYFQKNILPHLTDGKNVLVSAHGNSLRALVKLIENISENDIVKLEIATGQPIIYKYQDGKYTKA
ncbi:MAG: 2,3-bisphosphoglycerate-dependent phosphoglycerate mutase [Gammaproteobacteria bacterium]|nr:2,3-bisphosphoglycerate-dependent phosphoglycerate mutase [Gammaproteobacteria bacterium]|tara:strand:+ start:462 stop:1067 length:606 start_codon:yes stop_codon:yes gene_type:complete